MIRRFIVPGIVVMIIIGAAAYFARSWIRGTLLPVIVISDFKPQVDATFSSVFSPVNGQLQPFGISMDSADLEDCAVAGASAYQGISETINCSKLEHNKPQLITPGSQSYWQQHAPQLQSFLLQHGWRELKTNIRQPYVPIATIFNDAEQPAGVRYDKAAGKIDCMLYIGNASPLPRNHEIVAEQCNRSLDIFGGSIKS